MSLLVSMTDYVTLPRPNIDWLIPDLLPKPGLIFLTGEPKSGKSYLALQLALCLTRAVPFLGYKTQSSYNPNINFDLLKEIDNNTFVSNHHGSSILYLQLDTSELVWRDRLLHLQKHIPLSSHVLMPHPDLIPGRVNVLERSSREWLRSVITDADPALIILDILRQVHNADEDSSTEMKAVFDELDILFKGRTILLIHHSPKLNDSFGPVKVVNALRGSSYMSGHADAIWLLHNNTLHIESRFSASIKIPLMRESSGLFTIRRY